MSDYSTYITIERLCDAPDETFTLAVAAALQRAWTATAAASLASTIVRAAANAVYLPADASKFVFLEQYAEEYVRWVMGGKRPAWVRVGPVGGLT